MIGFHRFLISTAIVFCLVIGVWLFTQGGAGIGRTVLAVSFCLAGVGLGYYLKHLNRFLHR